MYIGTLLSSLFLYIGYCYPPRNISALSIPRAKPQNCHGYKYLEHCALYSIKNSILIIFFSANQTSTVYFSYLKCPSV